MTAIDFYTLQYFDGEVWKTAYASTFQHEADDAYDDVLGHVTKPVRLVRFTLDNFDIIAGNCRDFAVLDSHTPSV